VSPALPPLPVAPVAPAAATAGRPDSGSTLAVGPRLDEASVAVRAHDTAPTAAGSELAAQPRRAGLQQSQVLMIVGGAAFLAGAIIGDDAGTIIMIGGAAVGIYGLYQYLQGQ
jgi:predicted phage tail protein